MKVMRKLFAGLMAVILMGSAFGYASLSQAAAGADTTAEYGTESIRGLETASRLRELALLIDYYDEVLTQSARNYAFTQDKKWEKRYRESEPKLIATLEEALANGDRTDKEFLERIDKANLKLVEMEYRSIELVNAGQRQQAVDILESSQYWQQKRIYNQSLKAYVQRRGEALRGALLSTRRDYPVVRFTDEEKKWLEAHPVIRLGFNPDMEPLVIVGKDGSLSGVHVEIFEKLQGILGVKIELDIDKWPEVIEKAKKKEIDGMTATAPVLAKALGMPQTKPYYHAYLSAFARKDRAININSLEDLEGLTIVHLKGVKIIEHMLKPLRGKCTIIKADSTLEVLTLIQDGKADVAIGLNHDTYFLKKFVIPDIRTIFSFMNSRMDIGATLRADWPELVGILNKGIDALGEDRIKNILAKWIELPASTKTFVLTEQEKTWLQAHPVIRLGFTNIIIETGAWPDISQRARNQEIDGIAACSPVLAKANRLLPTRSHFINYVTVFVQADDQNEIKSFKDLEGRTISHVKGFKFAEILLKPFQEKIKVIETRSTFEAIKLVLEGKADAAVGLNIDNYLIARHLLTGIKAGFIDIDHPLLAVTAIRNDWPELVGILNKGIDSIGQAKINEIAAKWINLPTPTQTIQLTEKERAWLEA
jgi:ABC-type amino acid transport substrate-binding protein